MIAQHGAFNREDIEKIWEQQVVIPPGMLIPETPIEIVHDMDEDDYEEEDDDEEEEEEEEEAAVQETVVDDRNQRPKKLSLFRAARLTGSLSKQE